MENPLVNGEIQFAWLPHLPDQAKIFVRLLDVSLLDAPAHTVAEQVLTGISHQANAGQAIPFALTGKPPDQRASYTVSVVVDLDGDGNILSPGDFISMQSYPVLTYGHPSQVSIEVKEIK